MTSTRKRKRKRNIDMMVQLDFSWDYIGDKIVMLCKIDF